MTPEGVVFAILEAVVQNVGLPVIIKWLAGVAPQDTVATALAAEYAAARAAADAEAAAVLR